MSSWWTLAAPCRWATPRQSAAVSPPPLMITCLPAVSIGGGSIRPGTCRFDPTRCYIARRPPGRQQHGVVAFAQLLDRHVDADVDPGRELHALRDQLLEPPVDVLLLQLEVGDAVPEQAADPVVALVHGDLVPGPGQLLRAGQ